ncbi:MAG: NAD(P)-dependent oxidoreductase [Bacteroidetes bacterium]|nr:NAD(P)-dependent oxidoreductase [Bacteroidota bacterium]
MKHTVLGASGFIGNNLKTFLEEQSLECFLPPRNYSFSKNENLGHVYYCIGLTSDFRTRPMETVKAHVCKLIEVLENSSFESFLYLSSARVYNGSKSGDEQTSLSVNPSDFSDLYNISKLMGEAVCLAIPNEKIRIARLSNVIGNDFESENFLFSLIKEAVDKRVIELGVSSKSEKDYISINDVVQLLLLISSKGKSRIYNVSSGQNVSNEQLVKEIKKYTGCSIRFTDSQQSLNFPLISNERLKSEFDYEVKSVLPDIMSLIENYKAKKG